MTIISKKHEKIEKVFRLIRIDVQKRKKKKNILIILLGSIIGFVNGFCGGGGGMICVPTLEYCLNKDNKTAHSTAIFVMLPLCVVSLIVYCLKNSLEFKSSLFVSLGFVLGGLVGAILLKKIKNIYLEIIFCFIIFYCGAQILIRVG